MAAQEASEYLSKEENAVEIYWKERLSWSKDAGILYWKVDWGKKERRLKFRRFLSSLGKEIYPDLYIDHCATTIPLNSYNGNGRVENVYVKNCVKLFAFSNIIRLYDVTPQLSIPTMLDRASNVLKIAKEVYSGQSLLCLDDEVYMAAALGCTMGIMRHPLIGFRPNGDIDLSFTGPRRFKRRIDEVIRAIRWQRIAPPFHVGTNDVLCSDEILFDDWYYQKTDTWFIPVFDTKVKQGAPAIVSRGLELPRVESKDDFPYVITSQNPNGAISIATLGRVSYEKGFYFPKVDVSLKVEKYNGFFGIFGYYKSLSFQFNETLKKLNLFAQDLAGDQAINITNEVIMNENIFEIDGSLIEKYGLSASKQEDISDPGLLIYFK